jgi:UDP-2,4-diacetamido-2,4,6-trideoxy-beta-L-altropyranose hydrolase
MKVIFRADGGHKRGLGHLMRCLALADACAEEGASVFFGASEMPPAVQAQIAQRDYQQIKLLGHADKDTAALSLIEADWLVIDSYDIDAGHRSALAPAAKKLAIIDDAYDNGPYNADLLINPNPGATLGRYDALPATQVQAIGANYVFIRRDILSARRPRTYTQASKLLISCGGSDPSNAAQSCLEILAGFTAQPLEIQLLLGPAAKDENSGRNLRCGPHSVHLLKAPQPVEQLLNWADAAILAAGTTQWEAAYLGCPFLALIVAGNQAPGAQFFAQQGASIALDWRHDRCAIDFLAGMERLLGDVRSRADQAGKAQELIDGQGAARLAAMLT